MLLHRNPGVRLAWISLLFLALHGTAFAQATRTWVSGVGDDANPCSRTAPCKTFAGAISKTATGGVISVLDPGGFGAVTVTKAITIDGGGQTGSILAAGVNGVVINAPATAAVHLRNLEIDGAGSGLNGIRILAGAAVYLDNVTIREFTGQGVQLASTGDTRLTVTGSDISDNGGAGIYAQAAATGFSRVTLSGTRLVGNSHGLKADDRAEVAIRDSVISSNVNSGVFAASASQAVSMSVFDSQLANNGNGNTSSAAVKSSGALASVLISGNAITGNYRGLYPLSGGDVLSFGGNRVGNNTVDGTPTGTLATR